MIAESIERLLLVSARLLLASNKGTHSTAQCIYIANHSSHLDAVLLLSSLPAHLRRRTRPVAAAEYWTTSPLRRYLIHSIFRGVLVDRDRAQLNPLEPAADALRQGDSLIFFPEGTRGPGGVLLPLKPGIFHLARWFPGIDIVPVWIRPVPLHCSLTFGPPLRWKPGQGQEEFLSEIREGLEALQPR
jgi:1-acyl-sn-glycerol-3-phosphate acyltransferase